MKRQALIFLIFLACHFSFAQTEQLVTGKVLNDVLPVQGVEIINLNSQKTSGTDKDGIFNIAVKLNDTLIFYSKDYDFRKIIIKPDDLKINNLIVKLTKRSIELDEVTVQRSQTFKIPYNQAEADKLNLEKSQTTLKNSSVDENTIVNGVDFVRIGKDAARIFKKIFNIEDSAVDNVSEISFKDYVTRNIPKDFFVNTLKLQPEEITLFIEFCNADPRSKSDLKYKNPLNTMDYLTEKNIEFKKFSLIKE